MSNEEYVSSIFVLMYKLRNTRRKGWYDWKIKRDRVESVADHIYGCQMLAYAMKYEFEYDVDIDKVILMLAVHEIGETVIGDITPKDMSGDTKKEIEENAVRNLLNMIPNNDLLKELFNEFEERKTKEAIFAYQIDKAECDLQARLYDQDGAFADSYKNYEFTRNWVEFDIRRIDFDDNFDRLLDYIINNEMLVRENSSNKIEKVVSFYTSINSLKDVQRTGEKIWGIKQEHYGSIAEHIYNTEMLAIIIYLIYGDDIDITKVVNLLSVHEIGEVVIGDKSAVIKNNSDRENEWMAALRIINLLSNGEEIKEKLLEFNECVSREAKYARYCDKLAPDIISKIYDQLNLIDLDNQMDNPLLKNEIVERYLSTGKSFSEMWILYGQEVYKYPEPFISISNYVLNNRIKDKFTVNLKIK